MDRRKFLQGAAALFAAPAIVRADALMNIDPRPLRQRLMGGIEVYVSVFDPELIYDISPTDTPLLSRDTKSIEEQIQRRNSELERDLEKALGDCFRGGGTPEIITFGETRVWKL